MVLTSEQQTAAQGAESFYQIENNNVRKESLEEARAMDEKTSSVWVGHEYMDFIANDMCDNFETKMQLIVDVSQHHVAVLLFPLTCTC